MNAAESAAPWLITSSNPDAALAEGLRRLQKEGLRQQSRNGVVLAAPGVVVVHSPKPLHCISTSKLRNANPFFHALENLWMLAGYNDAKLLQPYVPRITDFADNGTTLHGAYGYRWRAAFRTDQLIDIAELLKQDPTTRRAVLQMWAAELDLKGTGKDLPCNTECVFRISGGALHMTVHNRSNDAVWGCHGANIVHFSGLLSYMSWLVDAPVGTLTQVSTNYHVYSEREDVVKLLAQLDTLEQDSKSVCLPAPPCGFEKLTHSSVQDKDEAWRIRAMWVLELADVEQFSPIALNSVEARMLGCPTLQAAAALRWLHAHYKTSGSAASTMKQAAAYYPLLSSHSGWLTAAMNWLSWRVKK